VLHETLAPNLAIVDEQYEGCRVLAVLLQTLERTSMMNAVLLDSERVVWMIWILIVSVPYESLPGEIQTQIIAIRQ